MNVKVFRLLKGLRPEAKSGQGRKRSPPITFVLPYSIPTVPSTSQKQDSRIQVYIITLFVRVGSAQQFVYALHDASQI